MKNVLITGGAGFIGSHLAQYYLNNTKYQIFILDNFNDYYSPSLKQRNYRDLISNDLENRIMLIKGDIREKKLINSLFTKYYFAIIFHLAAMTGVRNSIENPGLYVEVNIQGTLNILNAVKNSKNSSLIFASSSSVYGNSQNIPYSETMKVDNPISPYAATKKSGEELCYLFHHLYDIHITCLRFFTVYGPRGRPDMAPFKFLDLICKNLPIDKFGDGSSERDYTFIDDIIQGIVLAAEKNLKFEIINLGRGETTKLNKFISLIELISGKKAKINKLPKQPGDVDVTLADITKAKQLLDFNPKYSLTEGISKFYKWYKYRNGSKRNI